jgi:hypothetical protein
MLSITMVVIDYCLNEHTVSYMFMKMVYDKIFEILDKHPDEFDTLVVDFNACVPVSDSLNRLKTKQESYLTEFIKQIITLLK